MTLLSLLHHVARAAQEPASLEAVDLVRQRKRVDDLGSTAAIFVSSWRVAISTPRS
jgi:hypothetical protein